MVSRDREEDLLQEGDPLREGASLATRPLAIDEVDRIRAVLHDAGIACRVRLVRPGEVKGLDPADLYLLSEFSVLRPSWNVIVAPDDVARARAKVERELRTDVDGRADTAALGGLEPPAAKPVPLCVLPWDDAWTTVERLAHGGIRAAVGAPLGDGPLDGRDCAVLVLPDDVAKARAWLPDLPPLGQG